MTVYLGADHRGFRLKNRLVAYLEGRKGLEVIDLGAEELVLDDDYPDISQKVGMAVREDPGSLGILLCGSGVGATIAANKIRGVRASLVPDAWTAQAGRNDDDMNVICLAADRMTFEQTKRIVRTFLQSSFSEAKRFRRRRAKVQKLDQQRP